MCCGEKEDKKTVLKEVVHEMVVYMYANFSSDSDIVTKMVPGI